MKLAPFSAATNILRADHERVKTLFREVEDGRGSARERAARECVRLLQNHDVIEQKLFYPFARKVSAEAARLILRAREAHHAMNVTLSELMLLPFGERYFAKFHTLSRAVLAHAEEEENEIFPLVERADADLDRLGREMSALKESLEKRGPVYRAARGAGAKTFVGLGVVAALAYGLYALVSAPSDRY